MDGGEKSVGGGGNSREFSLLAKKGTRYIDNNSDHVKIRSEIRKFLCKYIEHWSVIILTVKLRILKNCEISKVCFVTYFSL